MRITFGDFFISKGLVYRTYTNYHPENGYCGFPLYKVESKNLINLETLDRHFSFVNNVDIEEIIEARRPINVSNFVTEFVFNQLDRLKIQDSRITGSLLLEDYGYKKIKKSPLSDLDFLICGQESVNLFKEKYSSLHSKRFLCYDSSTELLESLQERRAKKSNIKMDLETIKNFEAKKPIWNLEEVHVNITPSYIISSYDQEVLEDCGFKNVSGTIIGDESAFCLPGYYDISCDDFPKATKLKSNMFFFLIGLNQIGSRFKIKARLLRVKNQEKEEFVLEVHSKWKTQNLYLEIF